VHQQVCCCINAVWHGWHASKLPTCYGLGYHLRCYWVKGTYKCYVPSHPRVIWEVLVSISPVLGQRNLWKTTITTSHFIKRASYLYRVRKSAAVKGSKDGERCSHSYLVDGTPGCGAWALDVWEYMMTMINFIDKTLWCAICYKILMGWFFFVKPTLFMLLASCLKSTRFIQQTCKIWLGFCGSRPIRSCNHSIFIMLAQPDIGWSLKIGTYQ